MHSLNNAVLGRQIATERAGRLPYRALHPHRPERPPNTPLRGRIAWATGRLARWLDSETARRAVA